MKLAVKHVHLRIYFFCVLILACIGIAIANESVETRLKELRYPNSYNVRIHEREEYKTVTVTYETKLPYPSKAVLEFYDRELKTIGWVPFAEPDYKQSYIRWTCFQDGTKEGNPTVHQLMAKWRNRDKTRMVFLGIRYYSHSVNVEKTCCEQPNNDVQYVHFQIMSFQPLPPNKLPVPK